MSLHKWILLGLVGLLAVGLAAVALPAQTEGHGEHMAPAAKADHDRYQRLHAHLAAALKAVDAATKAVESGDKKAALAELAKLRKDLTAAQKIVPKPTPHFANVRCPIKGTPINPEKVTPALTREFHGQMVAFCCGGCPEAWDKLTDAEKQAKLAAAMAPAKAR